MNFVPWGLCSSHTGDSCCTMHSVPLSVVTDDFCLPLVLLWNPLLSYEKHVKITCPECGSLRVQVKYWNDGSCPSRQPRMLHTLDNIVLLISSVYKCDKGHECLSHDARILALFPPEIEIPFVLLHRTGFTTEFVEMCSSFVRYGMNFYNMESVIIESRWRTYARNFNRFNFPTSTVLFLGGFSIVFFVEHS